jgi:hypothetical protein
MRVPSRHLVFAAACVAALGSPVIGVAASQPTVAVSYQLDDPDGELPVGSAPTVAAQAAASICRYASDRWAFLRWVPEAAGEPAAKWVVRLEVRRMAVTDGAGHSWAGSEVRLRHVEVIGGVRHVLEVPEADEVLYSATAPKPGGVEALRLAVERHLARQLPGLVGTPAVEAFARAIPLCDRIVADTDHRRLLILVDRRALRAEPDSELEVRMPTAQQPDLFLIVQPLSEVYEDGDLNGCVRGWIVRCNSQALAMGTWWDDNLPPLLDSALRVQVFMRTYKPGSEWTVSGPSGLADDPFPPTGTRCPAAEVNP